MNQQIETVTTKCTECGSAAIMPVWPAENAGIWQCTNDACGASDNCSHPVYETQTHDVGVGDETDMQNIEVCLVCLLDRNA